MLLFCSRKLHACVDWNAKCLTAWLFVSGRKLHACVDWNFSSRNVHHYKNVASYMLAWIEINLAVFLFFWLIQVASYMLAWIEMASSMTRWLSLNVASYMLAWIEISAWVLVLSICTSQATHLRELKFHSLSSERLALSVASYMLAWVEMTYSLRMNCSTSVANYMLAWIETLLFCCSRKSMPEEPCFFTVDWTFKLILNIY